MADASIETLADLLRALGRERGLRGRLRVIGRSWRLLRSLTPAQREKVALRLGSKWAWERIEKTFLEDGELSDNERMIGRAFERMGTADPDELRRMARSIREGDTASVKDALVDTLGEVLEETAAAEEAELLVPASPGTVRAESGRQEPEDLPPPTPTLVEAPAEVPASSMAPEPSPPKTRREREPIRLEPSASPEASAPYDPYAFDIPAVASLEHNGADHLRILRQLEREARPGAAGGASGRESLLASLGGGWASRRALSRMIRANSVEGLDEALQLIRGLDRPGQRLWCLADLLEHWDLDEREIEAILEQVPSDSARRRLARRAQVPRSRSPGTGP